MVDMKLLVLAFKLDAGHYYSTCLIVVVGYWQFKRVELSPFREHDEGKIIIFIMVLPELLSKHPLPTLNALPTFIGDKYISLTRFFSLAFDVLVV